MVHFYIKSSIKLILMAFMLWQTATFAQTTALKPIPTLVQKQKDNGAAFNLVSSLLQPLDDAAEAKDLSNSVQKSTLLQLNPNKLTDFVQQAPTTLTLVLPFEQSKMAVELVKVQNLSEDFTVSTSQSGKMPVPYKQGVYYRGILKDDNNSVATFSFFEGEMFGIIANKNGNYVLGRIEKVGNTTAYILYNDKDLLASPNLACGTEDTPVELPVNPQNSGFAAAAAVNGCVRVYLEADYVLFNNKGNSTQNTVNFLTAMYNNVAAIYQNEQISTVVSQIYVWTTPDGYPTNSSASALSAFTSTRLTFNADIGHLIALGGSNLGGRAYINAICNASIKYAYSNIDSYYNNVPTYSWTIMVVTHEMGHNLGSPHTQSCGWVGGALDNCFTTEGGCPQGPAPVNGGTIMSYCHLTGYGINLANGFGTQPGNLIRARVAAGTCLAATCGSAAPCPEPTDLFGNAITANSISVEWTPASNAMSYSVEYKLASATTWAAFSTNALNYTFTGLASNTTYNFRVKTVCTTSSSTRYSNQATFTTLISCNAPTNLLSSNITATSANLSWTGAANAIGYTIEYKLSNSTIWTSISLGTAATSFTLSGLLPSATYNIRVKTYCGSLSSVLYSNEIVVNTPTLCGSASPTIISAVLNGTTYTINWAAIAGVSYYQVEYKLASATTWTTVTTTNLTYIIANLLPGTTYDVRIKAVCPSGVSSPYWTVSFTTPIQAICAPPLSTSTSNITTTSAVISWSTVAGSLGYVLEYAPSTNPSFWTSASSTSSSLTLTNLQANTTYLTRIRAICSNGVYSAYGAGPTFTTLNVVGCNAPTNLSAYNMTTNSVTLSWTTVSGVIGYIIDFATSTNPNAWSTTTQTATPFTLYGLQVNTTYLVRIRTMCSGGTTSAYSSTISFTTLNVATCATAPTNLSAYNMTTNSVTLSWTTVSGATGYIIDFATSTNPNAWSTTTQTATPFTLYGLQANTTYLVRIRTVCSNGAYSGYSSTVSFNTLNSGSGCNTPTGLAASNVTGTTAQITWNTVGGAINYSLDYAATNNPNYWITSTPNTNSFALYNLQTNMMYQIRIKTVCGGGAASAYSSNVFFTTAPKLISGTGSIQNDMTVVPNPVTDKFNVVFALLERSNVDLEMTDVTGKVLRSEKLTLQDGAYEIDIRQYASGVYFVRARINEKELLVKKVIK